MLCALIFIIFLFKNSCLTEAHANCRTSPVKELIRKEKLYQKRDCSDSFFTQFQKESLQKVKELENNEEFQEIMAELQSPTPRISKNFKGLSAENSGELYIFISFSLGEKALLNLAQDAKRFGATLLLRGFKDGSYAKTVQALTKIILKTGQGVIIDPELYSLFDITAVPTFILAKPVTLNPTERTQTPIHDKLQGHVSTRYVLETFAKEGDLKNDAQALLKRGAIK